MPQPVPASPETTPQWASGARRRIPFYLLASLLLALLAAVVTFIYLEQARAADGSVGAGTGSAVQHSPGGDNYRGDGRGAGSYPRGSCRPIGSWT